MWRILLLFIIFFTVELSVKAQSVDNQLEKIKQQNDKTIAVNQLNELLESEGISYSQRIKILLLQSRSYLDLSDLNQALIIIQQAKKLTDQIHLPLQQAEVDKLTGIIFYFQGQYDQALLSYQEALHYFKAQPFSSDIAIKQANILNNIALVQTTQGDAPAALKTYEDIEPLYQRYGSEVDRIDVRYNLAVLHISLRHYDLAISLLEEVVSRRKLLNDELGVAEALAHIGVSYKYSGQYKKAEEYGLRALNYFQENDKHYDATSQLHNLAEINYELSNLQKAIHYSKLGLEASKKIGHQMVYAGSFHTLAKVYFHQGNIERARINVELSDKTARKMGFQTLINENLGLMSIIHAANNETTKALKAQLSYQTAHLKLSNQMLNEKLAQFESAQLSQQVKSLQQNKRLQQLESTKADQQRQFIVLIVAFILLVLFLIYRRYLESRLTKELEDRVKKRTTALEFLTKELQDANMIKSQFLANMSHEIRTPLTAVIGQSEAILYGDFDDVNIVKEVGVIHSNSLHLLQLINDILDLSKIEANKFELENRQQNLHEIVDKLNNIFTKEANRKSLSFTITHRLPNPFIIDVDGLRLKQILINLCSNAIKFTSEGWVTLDIAVMDKKLLFTVTDTGIGMNKEQQSKIFNSFTQADNSINRRFSGSGLGLFLSDQLAKVMSGKIMVTSEVNQGSTFVFSLPFDEVYSTTVNIDSPHDGLSFGDYDRKRYSGTILLADDHYDNRRLIARLLKSLGLNVLTASNGKEAIELCIKHKPALTLLDIQMPEMDGTQALKKLRDLGCGKPIYALTANAMSHEIIEYLALGFDGHLKKPIEREVFLATIDQYYVEQVVTEEDKDVALENFDMTDLRQSFIANLSQEKLDIVEYSDNKDMHHLARTVHKIAGAAKMFGFAELSQSASELEHAINLKHTDDVEDLVHCLLDEINLIQYTDNN